jgi:hypothetical protein
MQTMSKERIDRERIAAVEKIIRLHIRRTPVIEATGGDFGPGFWAPDFQTGIVAALWLLQGARRVCQPADAGDS